LADDVSANGDKRRRNGTRIESIVFDLGGVFFTEGKSVALEVLYEETA
jgi:hypothetical protein